MHYQDSRRVINPGLQEEPKQVKQRSISNTAYLLTWDTQKQKTDCTTNYQTSVSDVRQIKPNQPNHSSIQGFTKTQNKVPYYDFNEIINNQHIIQSAKERIKEKNTSSFRNENQTRPQQQSKSQEKQQNQNHLQQQHLETKLSIADKEDIMKLHKTELVKRTNQKNEKSQDLNLRIRIANYPRKSQSPALKAAVRPNSAMDDKSVTIMSLQLKDLNQDLQLKEMEKMCNNAGYHVVKFDQVFDKINHKPKGQGQLQLRGVYTDQKFTNFQRSLQRKGIKIGEQNQKLKDFISNKYLLKQQEHCQIENQPSINQDETLFNNFKKFQSRQKGSFV